MCVPLLKYNITIFYVLNEAHGGWAWSGAGCGGVGGNFDQVADAKPRKLRNWRLLTSSCYGSSIMYGTLCVKNKSNVFKSWKKQNDVRDTLYPLAGFLITVLFTAKFDANKRNKRVCSRSASFYMVVRQVFKCCTKEVNRRGEGGRVECRQ